VIAAGLGFASGSANVGLVTLYALQRKVIVQKVVRALVCLSGPRRISRMLPRRFGRIGDMETVWGALLSFLFVSALALSGHVETPSKEQIEQIEKAEKEKAEQIEKAEKEKKEQKEKAEQKGKYKQKEKQKESDVWRLRQ
jgi:hypothetical protein